ncbi:Origin recognition complex subunit 2 [Myotisia sp. PD_48]|nr:Origin recognition complex subunit 2 [Myotisia sp. PD_48]
MKRKQSDISSDEDPLSNPAVTPQKKRASALRNGANGTTPTRSSMRASTLQSRNRPLDQTPTKSIRFTEDIESPLKTPTARSLFKTPTKSRKTNPAPLETPSRALNADRSARRKSARILANPTEDDIWDGGNALAREIWDVSQDENEMIGEEGDNLPAEQKTPVKKTPKRTPKTKGTTTITISTAVTEDNNITPRKRGRPKGTTITTATTTTTTTTENNLATPKKRGRPKGTSITSTTATTGDNNATPQKRGRAKQQTTSRKRTPTPEGNLPPHEKYFFQTRAGPVQSSNNTLAKVPLFTHEEYFEQLRKHEDPLKDEKEYLLELHERSFPQWNFELSEGFNICLYGYGSKRKLTQKYADWLYNYYSDPPTIVIINGYTANITVRSILNTVATAVLGPDHSLKLGAQQNEILEAFRATFDRNPHSKPITIVINSIDAAPLRRAQTQSFLARLAEIPRINVLATADTPNALVLWDITLRDQLNFVFHDCTTFVPYSVEISVVDEIHSLFGRKVRRVGGKQGVGYVLKSLPENTRKLYRLLITELLTLMSEDQVNGEGGGVHDEDNDAHDTMDAQANKIFNKRAAIEWRSLFYKASEEFISSSEMMFRTQLKEFYDHQMITSKMDPSGIEMLGVPLSREEMESILEDLVIDS